MCKGVRFESNEGNELTCEAMSLGGAKSAWVWLARENGGSCSRPEKVAFFLWAFENADTFARLARIDRISTLELVTPLVERNRAADFL